MSDANTRPDSPATSSVVRLGQDRVLIDHVECASPVVVESARSYLQAHGPEGDLADWLTRGLELAARVESLAAPVVDLASHRQAIAELKELYRSGTKWFEAQLAERLAEVVGEAGALPRAVSSAVGQLEETLRQLTGSEHSPIPLAVSQLLRERLTELVATVQAATAAQARELQRLLAPANQASPLHVFLQSQREANARLEALVDNVSASLATISATLAEQRLARSTPIKGKVHEADLGVVLARIAHAMGADHEATGTKGGALGPTTKVGDHTLFWPEGSFGYRPTLVVEAKDRALSAAAWRKEAERAMENRQAQAYLGVVAEPAQVPGGQMVALVAPNVLLVAFDPASGDDSLLVASIRLMYAQAVAELRAKGGGFDMALVGQALSRAGGILQRFAELAKKTATIRTSADGIDTLAGELKTHLEAELAKAMAALYGKGHQGNGATRPETAA